jgi:hypothetical protein
MPHSRSEVDTIFRFHALQMAKEAGPGSWEDFSVSQPTPDGKAVLVVMSVPIRSQPTAKDADPGRGRRSAVPRAIMAVLSDGKDHHFSEILEALEQLGHSRSAVSDNLKVLVSLGLVTHPSREAPYRLPEN